MTPEKGKAMRSAKRRRVLVITLNILILVIVAPLIIFTTHQPRILWNTLSSFSTLSSPASTTAKKDMTPLNTTPAPTSTISGGAMLLPAQGSQATATPAAQSTATPSPTGNFTMLPPGAALPTEQECAARVARSSFEPRPDNTTANHSVPTAQQIAQLTPWGPAIGVDPRADALRKQITGNFTGTTDEILQWVACKWGIDATIVRAEAVIESYWHQSQRGDYTNDQQYCPPGTWDGKGCYQSYGILQIKYYYFQSAWPMNREDTAFNAEYVYGVIRTCYEGWTTYLNNDTPLPGYPRYHADDIWGCLGRWFSGGWYNQGAVNYIAQVKAILANKTWLQPGF